MAAPAPAPAGEAKTKKFTEQEFEMTPNGTKKYNICGMKFEVTKNYAVKKAVGQGAYGLVCSGKDTETGTPVAIKKIPNAFEDTVDCKRLLREIKILRHFKHDNILGLIDILPPVEGKSTWKDVYIVSDLMDTDLHYIIHSKQPLTDEHFKYFLYQILRGVHAIHSAHVLHRDLKPGNLLVNKNCDLKICDFGLARPVNPDAEAKDMGLTEYVVTRWYRAPELLVENQDYTTAIDVWAVGCIFAEMIGRKALFPGRDYLHQLRLIIDVLGTPSEEDLASIQNAQAVQFLRTLPVKPKMPWTDVFPKAAPQALELLSSMLAFNPAKRCSMEDALRCEYMAPLHQGRPLPTDDPYFNFQFEKPNVSAAELRELIWEEMGSRHPEAKALAES
jgi:mitogen-activated protein kinase 1/3